MDIIEHHKHHKVHLCPKCKNRLDRVEYEDGTVKWQCLTGFMEPPYVCGFELEVVKNDQKIKGLD